MSRRTHIIITLILLIILIGAIVYSVREGEITHTTTIPSQRQPTNDATSVRASHSYRLEDNISVPSEKTVSANQ